MEKNNKSTKTTEANTEVKVFKNASIFGGDLTEKKVKTSDNLDKTSKFICVVNKPIYYIIVALLVAFMLILADFTRYYVSYVVCTILVPIVFFILYKACYKYKYNRETLDMHKVSAGKKLLFFATTFGVGMISTLITAYITVQAFKDGFQLVQQTTMS